MAHVSAIEHVGAVAPLVQALFHRAPHGSTAGAGGGENQAGRRYRGPFLVAGGVRGGWWRRARRCWVFSCGYVLPELRSDDFSEHPNHRVIIGTLALNTGAFKAAMTSSNPDALVAVLSCTRILLTNLRLPDLV